MSETFSAKTIGHGAIWSIVNQSAGQILALAVFLVTARFVDKDAFGVMAIALVTIEFFRQIVIESVGISLAAKQNPSKDDYNAGFCIILLGSVFSAALMFALSYPVSVFLNDPDLEKALQMTCPVLLAMGLARTHETWMTKSMRFRLLALRSMAAYAVGGGIGIYMAVKGYGLLSLIMQQIVTSLLNMGLLWVASDWKPALQFRKDSARTLLSYARHVALNAFTGVAGAQADTVFSSYYLGAAATGVYNAAKRIVLSAQLMITSSLNNVALPVFAAQADQAQQLKTAYLKATVYTALLTAPLYAGLLFLSEDIVRVILGPKWMDVAPILSILCLPGFMASIDQYNTNIRLVGGKPHWQTRLTVLHTVLNLALLAAFAPFGLKAIATALAVKSLLLYPVSLYSALKMVREKPGRYFLSLMDVLSAALFMGGIVYYLKNGLPDMPAIASLMILIPTGAAIYILSLFILNRGLFGDVVQAGRAIIRRA